MLLLLTALALVTASCSAESVDTTTTSEATTTTVAATTTSSEPIEDSTTTTAATSTTAAPTTTAAPPPATTTPLPAQVQNVTVGLGGGSQEVLVRWDPNPTEDGVTWYNAYFSEFPGGAKSYVRSIDPTEMVGDRVGFIDHPRALLEGQTCYVITARTPAGEGPASTEACFDHTA